LIYLAFAREKASVKRSTKTNKQKGGKNETFFFFNKKIKVIGGWKGKKQKEESKKQKEEKIKQM
jgi:hypothetical protein